SNTPPGTYTGSYERTSDTQIHFTDLQASTTYYFWVRAYCDEDSHGEWGPLAMFTTPTQVSPPWAEGFVTTDTPQGWETTGWTIGTRLFFSEPDGNTIYKNLYYNFDVAQRTFTTLHVGDIRPGDQLSFHYLLATSDGWVAAAGSSNFTVAISADLGTTYTDIETIENNGVGGWQAFSYPLDDYTGETIQVRIIASRTSGDYYLAFDDFYVGPPLSCPPVVGVNVSERTTTTAKIAWDEPDDILVNGYRYYISTSGTPPEGAVGHTTAQPFVWVEDLLPATTYFVWVRAECEAGDSGSWGTPASFTTGRIY